jgi:hypothetical protein
MERGEKQLPVMLSKLPLDKPGRAFGYAWVKKKKKKELPKMGHRSKGKKKIYEFFLSQN